MRQAKLCFCGSSAVTQFLQTSASAVYRLQQNAGVSCGQRARFSVRARAQRDARPGETPSSARPPAAARGSKLVVLGLGNPGPRFDNTRHNIGFVVANAFATRNRAAPFKFERRFNADVTSVRLGDRVVHVIKPRTFMNNSGQALRAVMDYFGIPLSDILVVVDDMALGVGQLRLRAKGSAGGHNGLRSVEKHVGGNCYARLKVGVGEPSGGADKWSDHVLGRFSRGDADVLDNVVWDCMDIMEEWVEEPDVGRIMNAFTLKKSASKR